MSLKEITVKLKGEDSKYSKSFLCYEEGVCLSDNDPVLNGYVEKTRQETKGVFDECEMTIKMQWV